MRAGLGARWLAGGAAIALGLAACGGGSSGGDGDAAATGGKVSVYNCKPQNPLIPTNTNETCGGNVVDALFTGLVNYDPDTANPVNAVAASLESADNQKWTITLNSGWTFHDGSPVTAKSFVDAWNWGAYGPNAQQNSYFFDAVGIDGYADVQGEDKNGDETITEDEAPITEMKGLTVVDDLTFEVNLVAPSSVFPVAVGYTAFSPLPEAFFADPEAFGTTPVGNGPFRLVSGNGDTGYTLAAFEGYKGPDKPKIAEVEFRSYQTPEAGYADLLAGNVDFMDQVPPAALTDGQYETDLQGRSVDRAVGIIQTATVPIYDDRFTNADLRKALSLAIDRQLIVDKVYQGGRTPATGWVSPAVNGYVAGACGEFCTFDPAKAKEFLDKAGGFEGTLTYGYNADGPGNKEAAEAIANSIKTALGIDAQAKAYVDFATLRTDVDERKMDGLFRTGWQMDYPSIENFLVPLYKTGASANDNDYSNEQFDALVTEAASLDTVSANAKYQEAEKLLAEDMTVIPLWYSSQQSGWSDKVENVKVTPFSTLDLASITVK
jgi:oligopeptide transport system substrate-binding protein